MLRLLSQLLFGGRGGRFLVKTALESNQITSILGVIKTTHIHIHMFMKWEHCKFQCNFRI